MRHGRALAGIPLAAGLAPRGSGVRFASEGRRPPPVHPRSHDERERRHTRRRPQSHFGLAFGLTISIVAVGIVAVLALAGREEPPRFSELKAALGVPASGKVESLDLDQVEFVRRLDVIGAERTAESFGPHYVTFYYEVQEGQAQIVLERSAWEGTRARVKQIALR